MRSILRRLLGQDEPEHVIEQDPNDPDTLFMPAPMNPRRVERAIVRGGQTVSLRQLREFGLSAIRVIDGATIQRVVKDTMEEVLRERPASAGPLTPVERKKVEDATSERVMELLQKNQRLEAAHAEIERRRGQLESQVKDLRHELEQRLADLQAEKNRRTLVRIDDASFVEMEQRITNLFHRMARDGELEGPDGKVDLKAVERELGALVHKIVAEVREKHQGDHGAEVEELELRIAKLNAALEQREDMLRKLAAMKGFDAGIASIFDDIQGLDPSALDFEKKSELLKEVFLQNLELQGLDILVEDQSSFPIQRQPVATVAGMSAEELGIPTPDPTTFTDESAY
jgi:hypothetical protein